jgi:hypothetical protein
MNIWIGAEAIIPAPIRMAWSSGGVSSAFLRFIMIGKTAGGTPAPQNPASINNCRILSAAATF